MFSLISVLCEITIKLCITSHLFRKNFPLVLIVELEYSEYLNRYKWESLFFPANALQKIYYKLDRYFLHILGRKKSFYLMGGHF